jgi:PAS domain S-box-containing protein
LKGALTIAASRERYRRFFDEDLTGNMVATPGGRILDCNRAFAKMFGFASVDAALGSELRNVFPKAAERRTVLRHLRLGRKIERVELTARRRDGRPVSVICNAVGDYDEAGRLVEVHAYLFDNTEQRQATERLRLASRMEAVGQLAGGIAHDFNNLITVITGYSELLLAGLPEDDPRRRELLEIKGAGQRAADLTHQLLAFSRQQVLQPRDVDLNAVVVEVESMLRRVIGEDIELSTVLAPDLGRVRADPGQLHQVILNLAVNSRDAMPDGGFVLVETANVDLDETYREAHDVVVPGPYVMLAVTDTGQGMDEATRLRVFEPFFTTKESGKGTGLGLSTVYGVVKQSGGYIWAYSEPGQGTTFKIYLPRVEATEASAARQPPAPAARGGTETVLVVEDSDAVRTLVGEILRPRGYSVIEATTGKEALEVCAASDRRIDLVISDVVMPDVRGPELEQRIAAVRPGLRFLFMSGYAGNAAVREKILTREAPFIEKPFGAAALAAKVREVLDGPPPSP